MRINPIFASQGTSTIGRVTNHLKEHIVRYTAVTAITLASGYTIVKGKTPLLRAESGHEIYLPALMVPAEYLSGNCPSPVPLPPSFQPKPFVVGENSNARLANFALFVHKVQATEGITESYGIIDPDQALILKTQGSPLAVHLSGRGTASHSSMVIIDNDGAELSVGDLRTGFILNPLNISPEEVPSPAVNFPWQTGLDNFSGSLGLFIPPNKPGEEVPITRVNVSGLPDIPESSINFFLPGRFPEGTYVDRLELDSPTHRIVGHEIQVKSPDGEVLYRAHVRTPSSFYGNTDLTFRDVFGVYRLDENIDTYQMSATIKDIQNNDVRIFIIIGLDDTGTKWQINSIRNATTGESIIEGGICEDEAFISALLRSMDPKEIQIQGATQIPFTNNH